ncbi:MAG TPA: DUF2891 domain-containing protein [Thermoanaerobaculia bacterium]|jgi:hypothetical protein|nr:DUF2891 domain-containing protein [Thermoanaerobaculia bacterium]
MLDAFVLAATLSLDPAAADRFATLALACVHQEYPNKVAHVLQSDADVAPPRKLTPAFYGCYDWHSSVHGHWLLARLSRLAPDAPFAAKARGALAKSITPETIAVEVAYLNGPGRASFERPYGLAWLLQLTGELREANDPLYATMKPLEDAAVERLRVWLPKLSHPVRSGEHSQTAFALGLILDSGAGDDAFAKLVRDKARTFYVSDRNCPLAYEPSGEDFLSPCLAEADAMRRVLPPKEFASWLTSFMPSMTLKPAIVTDPSDPKLAHLDGLNLSRAWMLEGIASGLPENDSRRTTLVASAEAHAKAGLAAVTGEHYEGGHWLGSFATYLVTKRGLKLTPSPSAPAASASSNPAPRP